MRKIEAIRKDRRLLPANVTVDGEKFAGVGWITFRGRMYDAATVVFCSDENGLEHVSVSFQGQCPSREDMCLAKEIFWEDEERVVEVHPKKSEYVNLHPYCLHLWRKKDAPED